MTRLHHNGFTLVELVVTITLSTIVVGFMSMFISVPVRAYADQTRRVELVDSAENTLRRIARDIRRALPNSIRISASGSTVAVEMLSTVDGVRYRNRPPPGDPAKRLTFRTADSAFNTIGPFNEITRPFSSTDHYLSIYNVGVPGADAYELTNTITPPGTRIDIVADTISGEDNVTLSPAFRFAFRSPQKRVYLVEGAVTYLCDTAAGTMTRYSGYTIATNQTDRDSHSELLTAGASDTQIAARISTCNVAYSPGTAQRAGLVSLDLAVSDTGETVSLLHQIHVDNVP